MRTGCRTADCPDAYIGLPAGYSQPATEYGFLENFVELAGNVWSLTLLNKINTGTIARF